MIYECRFMGDFETTVYEGQKRTEVWASALAPFGEGDRVDIFHSIGDTMKYLFRLKKNVTVFYHNLKFDGTFILDWLKKQEKFSDAFDFKSFRFPSNKKMKDNTYKYCISDLGQWYSITIHKSGHTIEFMDSLKLLPFSVRQIGEGFQTKHRKTEIEYTGKRFAGCEITDKEKEYIANDVLVVKEALQFLFDDGHMKSTIGSCALEEFKSIMGGEDNFNYEFPDLTKMPIDPNEFGSASVDEYIRKSYHGGWCYVAKGKENRIFYDGCTADVNSLYPSMMSGESGNRYPAGKPKFWKGDFPTIWNGEEMTPLQEHNELYYFVRFKCRFNLAKGMLPTVQIKGSTFYDPTEWLETSDIRKGDQYYSVYRNLDGETVLAEPVLTMTKTDFEMFCEHYIIEDLQILDGCYMATSAPGEVFDRYIEKFRKIKQESKGAKRQLAKLFLNSLYGKFAASCESNFKVARLKDDTLSFFDVKANEKKPGFIAIGSAITSYARRFTITAAQKNYHGAKERGFIYADTDSIHCDLMPEELQDVPIDQKAFCAWKIESGWDQGTYTRQKTYIEHIIIEDNEPTEPFYEIRCAGLPSDGKDLFVDSLDGRKREIDYTPAQLDFIGKRRTLKDFKAGLMIPDAKLMPKRIDGGTILVLSNFIMHEKGIYFR